MSARARTVRRWLLVGLVLLAPLTIWLFLAPVPAARGKQAAAPLPPGLTPEQARARDLALADPRVAAATSGHRTEVFGVPTVSGDYPASAAACATNDCRQVELYLWDSDTAVIALVDLTAATVWDVFVQPGGHPGFNQRVADLAAEIARADPTLISELGRQPSRAELTPMYGGGICLAAHLCLAMTLPGERSLLWAVVDVTAEQMVRVVRTPTDAETPGEADYSIEAAISGCPAGGTIMQDGWQVSYETTPSDGFRVYNASHWDVPVLTGAKLAEWHVDYGATGFQDATGCGGGGGGYLIEPSGATEFNPITTTDGVPGFELAQDFRMSNWGAICNYRYKQHYQFYADGRFRVVAEAYGKGCATNSLYRPLIRIDLAVDGADNDSLDTWNGAAWVTETTEVQLPQLAPYTAEGFKWRVRDDGGRAYAIEPGQGQFGDAGRGDNAYLYAVVHAAAEGDSDLAIIGNCCQDNNQGPEDFINGESLVNQNVVLWYVPWQQTVVSGTDSYCWTVHGLPNPETYPCPAGPMFVPQFVSGYWGDGPITLGADAHFTSTLVTGADYRWDFGDGSGPTTTPTATHHYAAAGFYTVTLTVTDTAGTNVYAGTTYVGVLPEASFSAGSGAPFSNTFVFTNTSTGTEPLAYLWNFGDGVTSTLAAPSHAYRVSGVVTVTLTISNPLGTDAVAHPVEAPAFIRWLPVIYR